MLRLKRKFIGRYWRRRLSSLVRIYTEEEWSSVSGEAIDVVNWMLTKDPRKRPSAWELLSHSWFQSIYPEGPSCPSRPLSVSVLTRLKEFKAGSKMRQAALHLITSQFTDSTKYLEMRDVFVSLDVNKDGKLSREELMAGYKTLKLGSVEEVDHIMEMCDADQNGYLEFTEFLTATLSWDYLETETLEAAFNAFDLDKDGTISAKELKFLLEDVDDQMDEQVWDDLLREGDADRDGIVTLTQIDIHDFRKMIVKRIATKVSAPAKFPEITIHPPT